MNPSSFKAGDLIDSKYRVEHVLGAGGMGVVLAAKHIALNSDVAVKVLLPKFQRNGIVRERFLREARSASTLRSSHVTKILDVGTDSSVPGGVPYIVMERLHGCDLEALLDQHGPLEETRAIDYVAQACEALGEAHAAGIIHRDLKTENLFLDREGVKVLDFGISKASTDSKALTGTAEVMGTPDFMSPEQFKSARDVTPRSDVWALGAILYRLLTKACPFEAPSFPALCARIMTDAPTPIESLRPGLSREICALVRRCLDKDPAARFANAYELRDALRAIREQSRANERLAMAATLPFEAGVAPPIARSAPKAPPSTRKRRFALAALVVTIGLAAGWTHRSAAMSALHPAPLQATEPAPSSIDPLEPPASTAALVMQTTSTTKTARAHAPRAGKTRTIR